MTGEERKQSFDPFATDVVVKHPYMNKEHMADEILAMLRGMPLLKGNLRKGVSARRQLFQSFKARRRDG